MVEWLGPIKRAWSVARAQMDLHEEVTTLRRELAVAQERVGLQQREIDRLAGYIEAVDRLIDARVELAVSRALETHPDRRH